MTTHRRRRDGKVASPSMQHPHDASLTPTRRHSRHIIVRASLSRRHVPAGKL
ncbi:MAG: hypothetical protein AB2693_33185 [Candidatus Thiodiazotropha sp.]